MPRFNNLDELFGHWQNEADKYAALKRLDDFYQARKAVLQEPFQQRLADYAAKHGGAASLTVAVRDSIWREFQQQSDELQKWFDATVKAIVDHYAD